MKPVVKQQAVVEFERVISDAAATQRYRLNGGEIGSLLALWGIDTAYDPLVRGELLQLGIVNTREFGVLVQAGMVEEEREIYGARMHDGEVTAAAALVSAASFIRVFSSSLASKRLSACLSGDARTQFDCLLKDCVALLIELASHFSPGCGGAAFVIDSLQMKLGARENGEVVFTGLECSLRKQQRIPAARPPKKIGRMLHPTSIGIVGVSAGKMNFGRIILRNILASGYDPDRLTIIRPGEEEIDGVKCVESLRSLGEKLDLLVVAIGAEAVYGLVDEIIETAAVESVMLIPGGLGETATSRGPAKIMEEKIDAARRNGAHCPIFLGGNCLGIVSHPGGFDTWFIPVEKLPKPRKKQRRNSALVSQSGAFMITRLSKNPWLDPAYMIAVGNQNDLGHGDMLNYFADHDEVDVIGFYIEGFRDLDGLNFARAVRCAVRKGKDVIVYKAGRTEAGQEAAMAHTASTAGDFGFCRSVLTQAGAMVCGDFDEFSDLLYLAGELHGKSIGGDRVAAVSGAGFETVGLADGLVTESASLRMARPGPGTIRRLEGILAEKKLDALMEVRNPLDINPGADDEAHLECARALAADPEVDLIVVGLDPLSPVTRTLEHSETEGFDIYHEDSIVQRMPGLVSGLEKPVIGIAEGGSLYDAMVEQLRNAGVCTFRSCSAGMRALVNYTQGRLRARAIRLE